MQSFESRRLPRERRRRVRTFQPSTLTAGLEERLLLTGITLSPTTLPNDTVGRAYDQSVTATGGTAPYSYTISTGTLPGGLSLNSATGEITGTPTTTGADNFTITATDSTNATANQSYTVDINAAIAFTTTNLPTATIEASYSQQLAATGGTGTLTYTVTNSSLPTGLTLSSTGLISGLPTVAASSTFTVTATDTTGASASEIYTLGVNATTFTIATTTLPNVANGAAYSQQLTTTGATGSVTYAVTTGTLPTGLSLSATGLISGTATAAGTFSFTVTATDGDHDTATQPYSIVVSPAITFTTTSLPATTLGTAYNQQVAATGGTGTLTYSVSSGTLPTGLNLSATGALTGTPSVAGTVTFNITATDSVGATITETIHFSTNPRIAFTTTTLPAATLNSAYSQQLVTTGGTGAITYTVSSGNLPAGLSLSSSGAITGTPTSATSSTFTVSATDSVGSTITQTYTLGVDATSFRITQTSLPSATDTRSYSQQLTSTGGTGTVTFAITTGSSPPGLSFSTTGILSGTPTSAGTFNFTVTATDANQVTATQAYSIVLNPAVTITTPSLPAAAMNSFYNVQLGSTGGTGTITWTLATGSLPVGLSLSNTGLISGVPTSTGTTTFSITATDVNGEHTTDNYSLVVTAATYTITTASLPSGTAAGNYSQQFATNGGSGTSSFAVTTGTLPPGLSLSSAGLLSGTPTTAGTFSFTVQATDSANDVATHTYNVTINGAITFTTTSLPNPTVGVVYSQQLGTTGGTGTLTFSATTGSLPAGLTLSNGGLISGTPTAAGASTFTVTVADSNGAVGLETYTVTVGTQAATSGPKVTNLQRFGFHMQQTTFVITFNEALNASTAENVNNYTLIPIVNGNAGSPIPLASAAYDATNNTVTLSPVNRVYLYAEYRLKVNGTSPSGLTDTSGNFLAGQTGMPGTNYVQTFGREILAGPNIPRSAADTPWAARVEQRWITIGQPEYQALNAKVAALETKLIAAEDATIAIPTTVNAAVVPAASATKLSPNPAFAALVESLADRHSAVIDAVLATIVPNDTKDR